MQPQGLEVLQAQEQKQNVKQTHDISVHEVMDVGD